MSFFAPLFSLIKRAGERTDKTALLLCFCAGLFYGACVVYKYYHLWYYDWDLAFFSQACWNLLHGSAYSSLTGINFFGDHSYYIIILLLPFFWLFTHPLTLVFFCIAAHLAAGYLLYRLADKDLGGKIALVLTAGYFLIPANIFSVIYEFNTEGLSPVFLVLTYIFFQKDELKKFWIAVFFLLLIKENMALVVVFYGLYGLAVKKGKRVQWGIIPLFAGLFIFLVFVKGMIPFALGGEAHAFVKRYAHMGSSLKEILLFLVLHPGAVLKIIFHEHNLNYIWNLGGPWVWPALFSPQILFLMLPLLLQHLLSNSFMERTIFYHYGSSLLPFVFLAVIKTFKVLQEKTSRRLVQFVIAVFLLAALAHLYNFQADIEKRLIPPFVHSISSKWAMIEEIPREAGVIATFSFLAPLSLRKHLYSLHVLYDRSFYDPEKRQRNTLYREKFIRWPTEANYVLIDFDEEWLKKRMKQDPSGVSRRLQNLFNVENWLIKKRAGSVILFERKLQ